MKLDAPRITELLRRRYSQPEWLFVADVPDGVGYQGTRRADGVAISTWPSLGLEIHGFEVKVSRNDWRRELRSPGVPSDKWRAVGRMCDRWWVVTTAGVVKPGELPSDWGHIVASDTYSLRTLVEAPLLTEKQPRGQFADVPRVFVAALMRACSRQPDPHARWRYRDNFAVGLAMVDLGESIGRRWGR